MGVFITLKRKKIIGIETQGVTNYEMNSGCYDVITFYNNVPSVISNLIESLKDPCNVNNPIYFRYDFVLFLKGERLKPLHTRIRENVTTFFGHWQF